jgi:hypothetical protein
MRKEDKWVRITKIIGNGIEKLALRGAKRRGNLIRLLHFVRNGTLWMSTDLSHLL